jgi:hypothetical protein
MMHPIPYQLCNPYMWQLIWYHVLSHKKTKILKLVRLRWIENAIKTLSREKKDERNTKDNERRMKTKALTIGKKLRQLHFHVD